MVIKPKIVRFQDLGVVEYVKAWQIQTELHDRLKTIKIDARRQSETYDYDHHLLFAEHNHVYTLGKSGKIDHLLLDQHELEQKDVSFHKINRGGDITYHGYGQITAYPIFDLDDFYHDVHKYVRSLEEVVIQFLSEYGIDGFRIKDFTGVWVKPGKINLKVCAIGVHLSRWVTMHGIALNINTELDYYQHIVPCGINESNTGVTSLAALIGQDVDMKEAKTKLLSSFKKIFNIEFI